MKEINDAINKFINEELASSLTNGIRCGFADMRNVVGCFDYQPPLPYAISLLFPLDPDIVAGIKAGPTKEYYDYYYGIQETIDRAAMKLEYYLISNWGGVSGDCSNFEICFRIYNCNGYI